jgi:hypothetical protein
VAIAVVRLILIEARPRFRLGSPLIEAGLLDPDGLKTAVTELENGPYSEDPWSKLVEVITLDQAAQAFLP